MSSVAPSEAEPHDEEDHAPRIRSRRDLLGYSLGALGVVYGDIGTSPLYAMKECVSGSHAVAVNDVNILGILSLVFWALTLVVAGKYLTFIMRADNRGEGGILSLFALALPRGTFAERPKTGVLVLLMLGLFGAGLLFGESIITPGISVLSAVEGLKVLGKDATGPFVLPVTIAILLGLFAVQHHGTGRIGKVFGWVMLCWFVTIAVTGIVALTRRPDVLRAINPYYAVHFMMTEGTKAFFLLGSVVLVITGGEALYADMGHFGRRPIRVAWFGLVMPALLFNYFGQGAMLLSTAGTELGARVAANPFYALTPGYTLIPMLVLATMATVIASQALISGVFSLTRQAVQLGYFPRVRVVHTSGQTAGQIYIPEINWALAFACIALVLGFESSTNLAAAYGITVMGTMSITSVLFFYLARHAWGWSLLKAGSLVALFLAIDLSFLAANLNKIAHGGWFPLVIGAIVFAIMTTWRRGRAELQKTISDAAMPLSLFLDDVAMTKPHRVRGTAVFMTSSADTAPAVLLHHFKHNQVLHEQVILLSVVTERVPVVPRREMVEVEALEHGFYKVVGHVGFMQDPDVQAILRRCARHHLKADPARTSFYLGKETLLVTGRARMARWRKVLFAFLSRNARPATAFFRLPPNRVVEMGAQIEL